MAGDIRIYTDEHIANAIVSGLRHHGIDVITFREAGLAGASDKEHIERATSEGRAVLTKDTDFIRMHKLGQSHSGILFVPSGRSAGQIIKRAIQIFDTMEAEAIVGVIRYL